jgi:hypothetical protein
MASEEANEGLVKILPYNMLNLRRICESAELNPCCCQP